MWEFNVDVKEKLSTFSAGNETDSEAQKIQAKRDFGRSIHRPSRCLGEKKKKTAWGSGYEHKLKCQIQFSSVSSVAQPCPTLCDPMDCSKPGLPVHQPTPGVCPNSCPLSRWCHPAISSSVIPFSSCLQSCPASGSFQMSQFFTSGGQSIGNSALASVLPMNIRIDFL